MEWQRFFKHHASTYDEEIFTRATAEEVNFILEELSLPAGASILDMGCGTGRHSVALALRGFQVTGLDLSRDMLQKAKARAEDKQVKVTFLEGDATSFDSPPVFDAAICLCEGALCLLGSNDDPFTRDVTILKAIRRSLKPGSKFIATVLNAFRPARNDPEALNFDPHTQTTSGVEKLGEEELVVRQRYYTPPEFRSMLREAGFVTENLWGGTAGNWRRGPMNLDEFEFMIVARVD